MKEKTKAHCPRCGPERNCDVVASEAVSWHEEEWGIWGKKTLNILKCLGCDERFVQCIELDWDDVEYSEPGEVRPAPRVSYWPATSKRERPKWVHEFELDGELTRVLRETYSALDADLHVLAAIGLRTAFDRASILLNIDSSLAFITKTQKLVDSGFMSSDEKKSLDIVIDAGSAAAHRAWTPSLGEINIMMDLLEAFIERAFVLKRAAKQLEQNVPPKQKRLKP